jgi:hypothetical protein
MSARTCMSSSPQVMKSLDIPSNLEDPIHDVPSTDRSYGFFLQFYCIELGYNVGYWGAAVMLQGKFVCLCTNLTGFSLP